MEGLMVVIQPNGLYHAIPLSTAPSVGALQEAVEGYVEIVTRFETIRYSGEVMPCMVFCNEDGKLKGLAVNQLATTLWDQALGHSIDDPMGRIPGDVLCGPVVVVLGDEELIEEMWDALCRSTRGPFTLPRLRQGA